MNLFERLHQHHGVARRADLAPTAAERRALASAVLAGHVRDLGQGWVALPNAHPALVAARRVHAAISCVSAAAFYGLATLEPADRVSSRGASRPRPGPAAVATGARGETAPGVRLGEPADPLLPLVPVVDALARVLRCQGAEAAIVMVDSALNRRLVTVEEIERLLKGAGSVHARGSRCTGATAAAGRSPRPAPACTSGPPGLAVRAGVVMAGVGEVDLLVEEVVVVECDGFAYHSGRREFQEDRRRDRELLARGYVVLRFTWDEVMTNIDLVVEEVRQAVARVAGAVRPG